MKAFSLTLRVAGATLVLLALETVWGRLWVSEPFTSGAGLQTLSALLVVLALSLVAANSSQQGWTLTGTIFILFFGINCLNRLDEALIFKIGLNSHEAFRLMGSGFCTAVFFSPLLVLIFGYWNAADKEEAKPFLPRSTANWIGRIVLGDFLYVLFYFIAAVAAYPFVRSFLAGSRLPQPASIVEMEVVRGLVYVAAGLAVVHGMKGNRARAAATLGLAFPILAGVAPLLAHNPYLPDYVRLAQGFEVVTSNLAYGALLGHLLTPKAAPNVPASHGLTTEPFT